MKKIIALALMSIVVSSVHAKVITLNPADIKSEPTWGLYNPSDGLVFPAMAGSSITIRVDRFAPDGFHSADPMLVNCNFQYVRLLPTQSVICSANYGVSMQIAPGEFRYGSEGSYFYESSK